MIRNENDIKFTNSERSSYNSVTFPLTIDEMIKQTGSKIAATKNILFM